MNKMQIMTNELDYELDKEAFGERYTILKCTTSEKYISRGAWVLDAPELDKKIEAVRFAGGKSFYVLMEKTDDAVRVFKRLIEETDEWKSLEVVGVPPVDVSDDIVLQLLLGAARNYKTESLKFSNLTGKTYIVNPLLVVSKKFRGATEILSVPALEISVTRDLRLTLNVRTFTSELLKSRIKFTRLKYEQYPKYVLEPNCTMRRALDSDKGKRKYILRQEERKRSGICFMDIGSEENFDKSKMGMLLGIVEMFNVRYEGIASLDFKRLDVASATSYMRAEEKAEEELIARNLRMTKIRIVNAAGDEEGAELAEEMAEIIRRKYFGNDRKSEGGGVTGAASATESSGRTARTAESGGGRANEGRSVRVRKNLKRDSYNIRIVHNKEYYAGVDDDYGGVYTDKAVQHITIEDYEGVAEQAVNAVIHELMIKKNLADRKITLFDWGKFGFSGDMKFGVSVTEEDENRYFFMCVHPDGGFDIKEEELNLFEADEYSRLAEIFIDMNSLGRPIKGIVEDDRGQINIIRDDDYFTIPDIWELKKQFAEVKRPSRGESAKESTLASVVDIRYIDRGDYGLYFVGTRGQNLRTAFPRAVRIRRIEPYDGAEIFFDKLLPLMNVTFVRNEQLTVVPFPFKYLREYLKGVE